MKTIKMNWAYSPYLRQGSIGMHAKVAFDCFVSSDIFEVVKFNFDGTITKNDKKTSLYSVHVISDLMKNGFNVQLDGVDIKQSEYYGAESLIQQSGNSHNTKIAELSKSYNNCLKEKDFINNFHRELDKLFDNKKFNSTNKSEPADINWVKFYMGNSEMIFDFKYGVQKLISWNEVSHEHFVPETLYRVINKEKLSLLKSFIEEARNYKPKINDIDPEWQFGFDSSSYEAKKKKGYGR